MNSKVQFWTLFKFYLIVIVGLLLTAVIEGILQQQAYTNITDIWYQGILFVSLRILLWAGCGYYFTRALRQARVLNILLFIILIPAFAYGQALVEGGIMKYLWSNPWVMGAPRSGDDQYHDTYFIVANHDLIPWLLFPITLFVLGSGFRLLVERWSRGAVNK